VTPIETTIHDAAGPVWSRWPYTVLGLACLAVATMHRPFFLSFGVALLMLSPLLTGRRAKRKATLHLRPGALVVREADFLNQTIATRAVTGASAATRERGGITLALARGTKKNPVLLELGNEAELKAVRDALGIPHQGFGELRWQTSPRGIDVHDGVLRLMTGAIYVAYSLLQLLPAEGLASALATLLGLVMVPLTIVVAIVALFKTGIANRTLSLTRDGLRVQHPTRSATIPYADLARVVVDENGIALGRPLPALAEIIPSKAVSFLPRGLSPDERAHLIAQIYSAMSRARGRGPQHVDPTERVDMLRRANESSREWLTRIDVAAGALATGDAYRGGVLDEHELWAIAEDHDLGADARAGALRMLTRVAPATARVKADAIVASVHDDGDRKRMRVALEPDLEEAAREIDRLDEASVQKRRA
jgi:hypothetical protein